jgi:hypothetical protein
VLSFSLALIACEAAPDPVNDQEDLPMMGRVDQPLTVDGNRDEYPAEPLQVVGADIYLAHDGNLLYVHVETEVDGWAAVGFNVQGGGMDGANMVLGYLDEGTPSLRDDVGRGRTHSEADVTAVEDFYLSHGNGLIVMEFSYPLVFPEGEGYNISELVPGESYTMIYAQHNSSDDITRQHSNRGAVSFTIEP